MNQRIRQLAEQAGMIKILDEHAHEYGCGTFEDTPYPEMDKFVELIVRECEKVSLKNSHRDDDMGAIIARHIKQHFGVEE